jgi:hypothetical protein
MKKLTAIFGTISLCIASFFLGNYLAMSQARSIVRSGTDVAATSMQSSSMVRVVINSRILESINAGNPADASKWACKDLSSAKKNLKELSGLEALNKENIQKAIEIGDKAFSESCASTESPARASTENPIE